MSRPPKSKALGRLQKAKGEIAPLKESPRFSPEFKKWKRNCEVAIEKTFVSEEHYVDEFKNISYSPSMAFSGMSDSVYQRKFEAGLDSADSMLESMIEEIEEYWDEEDDVQAKSVSENYDLKSNEKIFVVHGREEGPKYNVSGFLTELGLIPVILDEQSDKGRTIIAKFEEEARDVGFAVVLLTPDDEGRLRNSDAVPSARARQNVIFELGFFAGALGRNHVCAIVKGDLEIPSDYDGVVYIPYDDSGGWKIKLFGELRSAGFNVNANDVF